MRFLVVGDWHSNLHEEPLCAALAQLGHEVEAFKWHSYFKPRTFLNRIFDRYQFGTKVLRLNSDLAKAVSSKRPDVVFVYRGTHVVPKTLRKIRDTHPDLRLVSYNNDDPFSDQYPRWFWRHFRRCIPYYDLHFVYRKQNKVDFANHGALKVELLRSWYLPDTHYPRKLTPAELEEFQCDVVFIGHYENDGRLQALREIAKSGAKLKLFGHGWDDAIEHDPVLSRFYPVRPLWGDNYSKALSASRIGLCFLSKLNRDTYTRRCFEIPACGAMLMSEYTEDLATMFKPDQEAVFFKSNEDLLEKLKELLDDPSHLKEIADNGHRRVTTSGHDVVSRVKSVVQICQDL